MAYKRRPKCHPHCKRGRHVFTKAEASRGGQLGFEAMKMALLERSPDLVCTYHGGHFSGCFLKHKNPLFFAARALQRKVVKFKSNGSAEDRAKLRELKQGVAALVKQSRKGKAA